MALVAARFLSILSTPPPPTQNIGSAPANFFSSLALFLQQNKQSNNYWGGGNKIEGCGSYTTRANSSGVSHIQKLNVSLNKAYRKSWVKVTIIKRKTNYFRVDDVLNAYGGGSSVRAIWQHSEVPWQWRWRVNKGSWIVVVLGGYLTPLFKTNQVSMV